MGIIAFYSYRSSASPLTPESENTPTTKSINKKVIKSTLVFVLPSLTLLMIYNCTDCFLHTS
jgi:hypothetical protein